jgi:hypothetical protein
LERVAGSSEKKLPRRLGAVLGHRALRQCVPIANNTYYSTDTGIVTSNSTITSLWKDVEDVDKPLAACSGYAGNYEDPDWSAWEEDEAEEEPGENES